MPTYMVTLPITGKACVEVEAESEAAAIEAALGAVTTKDIEEWEALECIAEGNLLHAMHPWRAHVECMDDPE